MSCVFACQTRAAAIARFISSVMQPFHRALITIGLLVASNAFMTYAWYFHVKKLTWTLPVAIIISWLIALPEYMLQVPANRTGHSSFGGPFSLPELKILQEAITLIVFTAFTVLVAKEKLRMTDYIAFTLVLAAVSISMYGRREAAVPASISSQTPPTGSP